MTFKLPDFDDCNASGLLSDITEDLGNIDGSKSQQLLTICAKPDMILLTFILTITVDTVCGQ